MNLEVVEMKERKVKERNLYAILAILGIFLLLLSPYFYQVNKERNKSSFINEVKYILKQVGEKKLMTVNFDIGTINETTINDILGISNNNYKSVKIEMIAEKVHITVIGKNKWAGLIACGTVEKILVVEGDVSCV